MGERQHLTGRIKTTGGAGATNSVRGGCVTKSVSGAGVEQVTAGAGAAEEGAVKVTASASATWSISGATSGAGCHVLDHRMKCDSTCGNHVFDHWSRRGARPF